MRKEKDSLILYYDLLKSFEYMTKEQIADLIVAIFRYEIHGEEPTFEDKLLYSLFYNIAKGLDINKEKYEERCKKNSNSIKKRWENTKSKANLYERIQTNTNEYECILKNTKNTDIDIDTDTENVSDNDIDIHIDNDIVNVCDNDMNSTFETHTQKNKYGKFSNILLDEKQYGEIKKLYPSDYQQRIDSMSAYMKSTGKTYADCFARLTTWQILDKKKAPVKDTKKEASYDIDEYMRQSINLVYDKSKNKPCEM